MNNNLLIGLVVVAVVILGGVAFVVYGPSERSSNTPIATTTPTTSENTVTTTTVSASAPTVTTSTLVVASNSVAVVTGKVTPNGSQTSYWYEYGTTNALGARTASQSIGGGYNNLSAPAIINGLSANTVYYYRLSASNALGIVTGQTYSFTTNTNPPLQGIGPTTRTDAASTISRTAATVNGQVNPNNSDTSYWFEYGETNELGNTTAIQLTGNGTISQAVSASLSGLKPLTKYYFRLNAQNQFGTMTGGTTSFTTTGPVTSKSPTVTTTNPGNVATSSAMLKGRLNPNGALTTYWFEYGTDALLGNILGNSTHTELTGNGTVTVSVSADIKNLSPNTKYYYQLVASNASGTIDGGIEAFTTKR